MTQSIDHLRQHMRDRRRRFGVGAKQRAAIQLAKRVSATKHYRQSRHIALYFASDGELDCRFLLKQAWRDGKRCYFPILRSRQAEPPMLFAAYSPGARLLKNRYGILEPEGTVLLKPQALDLVIAPQVICDGKGNRVGMGGGYYDKTFAFKKHRPLIGLKAAPWLLGVAYRFQQSTVILPQPWDVRLDQTIVV